MDRDRRDRDEIEKRVGGEGEEDRRVGGEGDDTPSGLGGEGDGEGSSGEPPED